MAIEAIRKLLSQSDKLILEVKGKLKEEKNKNILKVQEQLPTPEEITSRVKSEVCSSEVSNTIDKNFNNVKDKINGIKGKLEGGVKKLESLDQNLKKLNFG